MKFQIPKGLFDILPYDIGEGWRLIDYWQYVESVIRDITRDFGFIEIRTPVFERAELFDRGVGTTSDIVTKEMYIFKDKADRLLALRPEGTSSIMRAFAEKNFQNLSKTHKLYYMAPMFRYERPQAGRYRQHHQFGVEAMGVASCEQDAEIIDLLWQYFNRLGLKDCELQLNSVGDLSDREKYKKELKKTLQPHLGDLSKDSQSRFEKNPLRILDSKDPKDQAVLENVPSILDFITGDAKSHFQKLCDLLKQINIPYTLNPKIVRGLDYYNRTVFEVIYPQLGSQNAIGAGGRFDGFTEVFGIPSMPGIGFGSGLERVIQAMIHQNISYPEKNHPFLFLIPLGEDCVRFSFSLLNALRKKSVPTEMDFEVKKVAHSLQKANSRKAIYSLVMGSEEMQSKTVKLKNMKQRTEETISLENLEQTITTKWSKHEY